MPGRNTVKDFAPQTYYHVYNRGVEKRKIFLDDQDYIVFLGLIKKYLTGKKTKNSHNHIFKSFYGELNLLAYCLMPNHFHLLFYQQNQTTITMFMRRVLTGYVMYFNNRYDRVGGLFQGRYKASLINADNYLHYISRYIHLNPDNYITWPYSSLDCYRGLKTLSWINTDIILELFNDNKEEYLSFLTDYGTDKNDIEVLRWQLANGTEV